MTDYAHRKELVAQYKQARPRAGVYRIVNRLNQRALLGSSTNLPSVQSKLEFAKSVHAVGASSQQAGDGIQQLGTWLRGDRGSMASAQRLSDDIRQFGIDAFSMEVLEMLEVAADMTAEQVREDLAALEDLWREQLDATLLY